MGQHVLDTGEAPSVNPTGASSNDYETIQASPDQFGAGVGRAMQGLGGSVTGAADTGLDVMTARADLTNEIHASEVNTDLANKITDKFSQFSQLQGRAALDALPQFKADLAAMNQDAVSSAGNLKSQAMIARSSAMLTDSYYRYATNHADQQITTYNDQTAQRRATTFGGQATLAATQGDMHNFDTFMQLSNDEIRKQKEGIRGYDPDALAADLAKNTGTHVMNTVEQLATVGTNGTPNLSVAKALFDKYRSQMDPTSQLRVEQWLAPKLLRDQAQKNADQIMGGGGLAPDGTPFSPVTGPGHGRGSINATFTGPLDQPTVAGGPSPQQLYEHFIAKGATRNEALVLTSGAASEGVFNPGALHDRDENGNPTGYGMWGHRLDRRDQMFAVTGTTRPNWQQQADFTLQELRNRPEAQLVNAATTPVELANAEMHFEKPRAYDPNDPQAGENYNGRLNTIRRFTRLGDTSGGVQEATGAPPMQDKSAAIQKAMDLTDGNPALRAATISEIDRRYSQYGAITATEKQALSIDVPNKIAAAEQGVDISDFPEARIRAVFPGPKAQSMIDQFAIAKRVGTMMQGLQFASPDEILEAQRDINSGTGHLSEVMKSHSKFETTGPGTIGADPNDDTNGAYFRMREGAAKRINDVITQRSKMLVGPSADPSTYVMAEPSVSAAAQAAAKDPQNPAKLGAYASATLGVQTHLGVPEDEQHILSRGGSMEMAQKLMASGTDVRGEIEGLQKKFGPYYPKVFSDLVQLGKLPSSYQAVAALPDHDDANLLARALQQAPGSGDDGKKAESWNERIVSATGDARAPETIRTTVNTHTALQAYTQSLKTQGVSAPVIDNIVRDVQTLAQAKVYWNKMSAADASNSAVDAFTKQFQFMPNGGARVPTGSYDAVTSDANAALKGLDVNKIAIPSGFGGHGQPSREDYLNAVQAAPTWINTPKADGLYLVDHGGRIVRGADGQPFTVPFAGAGRLASAAPPMPSPIQAGP